MNGHTPSGPQQEQPRPRFQLYGPPTVSSLLHYPAFYPLSGIAAVLEGYMSVAYLVGGHVRVYGAGGRWGALSSLLLHAQDWPQLALAHAFAGDQLQAAVRRSCDS